MRLVTTTMVSLDGVMQGPGSASEDPRGGFTRGGWSLPLGDEESGEYIVRTYTDAAAFLLGRATYDIWADYWPHQQGPIADALREAPRYVASTTLTTPTWAGTTVLDGDVASRIRWLKAKGDGDLVVPGSGMLVRWLLARGLVDRLELMTLPVVVGQGVRLFPTDGPDAALDLLSSRATPSGIVLSVYRPTGRAPEYAD
ncbi:dihydrofolate reductase family protein [Schumannella luteola]